MRKNLSVTPATGTRWTRKRKAAMYGYLFLVPSLLILIIVGFYPLIQTVILSFYNKTHISPDASFVGLANYWRLLNDVWFSVAYKNTWIFTAVSVVAETVLGLLIALLLDKRFPGRRWVRVCVLIPWAIPTVISASMWEWIYNAQYGVLNYVLASIGLIDTYQNWLGSGSSAMMAAIFADVWKTTPFIALILLAGLQTISKEVNEAADIDGVSSWQRFYFITLPLLAPTMVMAVLLRALDAFRVFDLIFVLTGGGPANSTEVLSTYAYKTTFSSAQVSYGAAMSTVMALSVLVLAVIMLLVLRQINARFGGGNE